MEEMRASKVLLLGALRCVRCDAETEFHNHRLVKTQHVVHAALAPELVVVDVVGACKIVFRSSRILSFM
jgi:hypothetical protein